MQEQIFSCDWLGRQLTIKTGKLAKQATAALTVQYGETVVLATVVEAETERIGTDFFPLMVEFEERLYAAGIIKGSRWIKREGRPTDDAVLTGRMIDRSIRPLFDQKTRKDTQVIITVLSVDQENDYDIVSLVGASAVLAISRLDWRGPIGGVRVGRVNNELVFNPTYLQRLESDLDLIVAGTKAKTIMIEAGANEVKEADMTAAILAGQKEMQPAVELIAKMAEEIKVQSSKSKIKYKVQNEKIDEEKNKAFELAKGWLTKNIPSILFDKNYYNKGERKAGVKAIKEGLKEYLANETIVENYINLAVVGLVEEMIEAEVTQAILTEKKRVDGRALDEIRQLNAEVGILPRNHGAGLFDRGETQVLSIVTLGPPGDEQSLEGMEGKSTKRYMHHYNFPPYSVGEAKPARSLGRREIGHGALAEKALLPLIPTKEEFPYTIRVVSETLGSNGSSSMASTCASTLALMDAGVPIKKAVAGIAMGLASNADMSQWEILTDIQDLEDGAGGMDFKITGTADGITAIQLDTKTDGLTAEIVQKTLVAGQVARLKILEVMKQAIAAPRAELSKYAPRVVTFTIDPDKIRDVIGSGGKVINKIIEATGAQIDIEQDGSVFVCGVDSIKVAEAVKWINDIVRDFVAGEIFTGKVVRMLDFGAFVELTPGRDGLVHVSEMAPYRVSAPSDFLNIGDSVQVKIKEIDDMGRVNLTMKGLTENEPLWANEKGKQSGDFAGGFSDRGPSRPSRFGGRSGGNDRGPRRR